MATECLDATARPVARLAHAWRVYLWCRVIPGAVKTGDYHAGDFESDLKHLGGVYSNLNGAVSSRLDVTLYHDAALGNQAVLPN